MVIVDGEIGEMGDGNFLADLPGGRWEMAKIYFIIFVKWYFGAFTHTLEWKNCCIKSFFLPVTHYS